MALHNWFDSALSWTLCLSYLSVSAAGAFVISRARGRHGVKCDDQPSEWPAYVSKFKLRVE